MSQTTTATTRTDRLLAGIERVGNRLPDPFLLFLGLFLLVGVISTVLELAGTNVTIPGTDEPTAVRGLFTGEGLAWLTVNLGANFIEFPPLVTVVTILLAVTVAERTGMLGAAIRVTLGSAPRWLLPYAVGIVGVTASVMADASFIVVRRWRRWSSRRPAGTRSPGWSAGSPRSARATPPPWSSPAWTPSSPASPTPSPRACPNPGATVTPVSNYYFNVAASLVLALVAGLIIDKVVEPRLEREGAPRDMVESDDTDDGASPPATTTEVAPALRTNPGDLAPELDAAERRGLRMAGLAFLVLTAVILVAVLPAARHGATTRAASCPSHRCWTRRCSSSSCCSSCRRWSTATSAGR